MNDSLSVKKISVIIPVYNAEKYLEQCLNSVIGQTYNNLEIIIINDGSTDDSYKIIKKFVNKDKRIKLFNQENQGGSISLNKGIEYSTGFYICFLDSDDYLERNAYEILINAFENKKVDLCLFSYNFVNNKGKRIRKRIFVNKDKVTTLIKNPHLLIYYDSAQWMVFAKSSLIKNNKLRFDNTKFGYDMLFHLNIIKCAKNILILNKNLINYRVGDHSSSSGFKTRSLNYYVHFDCYRHCVEAFKSTNSEIRNLNICRQYDVCYDYLINSLDEYMIRNFKQLLSFSTSLDQDAINALKANPQTYERYLSIINFNFLVNYINNIKNSKQYKIGSLILKPLKSIRNFLNLVLKRK